MMTFGLWFFGDVLLLLLLGLGVKRVLISKYLIFYAYIGLHVLGEVLRVSAYYLAPGEYLPIYWSTQFVSVAASYFVLWEIFRHVLRDYPGTAIIARRLVTAIFILVLAKTFLTALVTGVDPFRLGVIPLERDLRFVQVCLLLGLQFLITYYSIPLGRNLRGLILGQGLFIATSMAILALRSYMGPSSYEVWALGQQGCAVGALLIWTHAFWSYEPNPKPSARINLEEDYALLVRRTNLAFIKARSILVRTLTS